MAALIRIVAAGLAASLMLADAALAQEPESIGRFRDWEAFSATEQGRKVCYALTSPQKSEGDYSKRDPAFIMVTRRPSENVYDEVSAIAGYTYQANSKPTLRVGNRSYTADAVGDVAWPKVKDGPGLIAAMKAGSDLELSGTSSRGTPTKDTFSLLGFTASLGAIAKSCPRR